MARETRSRTRSNSRPTWPERNLSDRQGSILSSWKAASVLCILLPIFLFLLILVFRAGRNNGDGGGGGEGEGWRNWGGGPENRGRVLIVFAYLFSLLIFVSLAFYGTAILSDIPLDRENRHWWYIFWRGADDMERSARNLGFLTGALIVFACFSFIFFLLSLSSMLSFEGQEQFWRGFGSPAMIIPLTFLLWTIFCAVFGVIFLHSDLGSLASDIEDDVNDDSKKTSKNNERDTTRSSPAKQKSFSLFPKSSRKNKDSRETPLV